jgi:phage protein D
MADTTATISIDGTALSAADLSRVQSVHIEQSMGGRDMVSLVVSLLPDNQSNWTSPLDPLVASPAVPYRVTLNRGSDSLTVEAYSGSVGWQITPGGLSTLTVSGMDASINLDRVEQTAPQQGTDSAVASAIFTRNSLLTGTITPTTSTDSAFTPQQRATDYGFLQALAHRNHFDVWVEFVNGQPLWNFAEVNPTAPTQITLDLAYGSLAGTPSANVDLLAGRTVEVTRLVPDTTTTDQATDDGTGAAMGARPLGGWATVRADNADVHGTQDAATTARSLARTWAFGASLNVTLTAPQMPLLRARRTVMVTGVGPLLSGQWLVRRVSHTLTQGGHSQAVTLARNALGASSAAGGAAGAVGALASAVGL